MMMLMLVLMMMMMMMLVLKIMIIITNKLLQLFLKAVLHLQTTIALFIQCKLIVTQVNLTYY